jgi:GT2 family glycosyltransferase
MLSTMIRAKKILDKNEIHFWLEGGSLLWAYRDHEADPTDTDFSVFKTDLKKVINSIDDFIQDGFTLHEVYRQKDLGVIQLAFVRDKKKVDIFFKNVVGKDSYHIATDGESSIVYKQPSHFFEYFDELNLGGEMWKIPNHIEDYLEVYYGDTWREHISEWNWRISSPSIDFDWKIQKSDSGVSWLEKRNVNTIPLEDGQLAIIVKTFMRDRPIFRFIQSVEKVLPNAKIYIADDSKNITSSKRSLYRRLEKAGHTILLLPYDTGLSYGRNELVKLVKEPYVLLCDDDFILTEGLPAGNVVKTLSENEDIGLIAGFLLNGDQEWHYEFNLKIENGCVVKSRLKEGYQEYNDMRMTRSDLVLNFFICKRELLEEFPWENDYIISMEHLDFFLTLTLKQDKWKIYYTPDMKAIHKPEKGKDYLKFRSRIGHWPKFADKWGVEKVVGEDNMMFIIRAEKCFPWYGGSYQKLYRDDDISLDSDIGQLKEIQSIFEKYDIRETYSVVPFGKTNELNKHFNWWSEEECLAMTGIEPITNNPIIISFLKESLDRGHQISLHGHTHTKIAEYPIGEIFEKIREGKKLLEETFGIEIKHYVSPFNQDNEKIRKVCDALKLKFIDGSGDQLEDCVRKNIPADKDFAWYHYWRFYQGGLTPQMLDEYLGKQ